jgi:peptidoglycan L-alanyl-D-glutamate endopeptidase CwlK
MYESIKCSQVDFGLSGGGRTYEEQLQYYLDGKSKLDPRDPEKLKRAMHLKNPSMAGDIYIYVKDKKELQYNLNHLCYVAGIITAIAERLYNEGKITHKIRWGGNWDRDSEILTDQDFDDSPHFELYEV